MPKTRIPADQVACPVCGHGGYEGQAPSGKTVITHPYRAFGCTAPESYVRVQHAPDCAAVRSQVRTVDGVPVYREPCNCGFRRSVLLQSMIRDPKDLQHEVLLDRFREIENTPGKNSVTDVVESDL